MRTKLFGMLALNDHKGNLLITVSACSKVHSAGWNRSCVLGPRFSVLKASRQVGWSGYTGQNDHRATADTRRFGQRTGEVRAIRVCMVW